MSAAPVPAPLVCPERLRAHLRASPLRIAVTGAGGWLGRATLELLDDAFGASLPERVHAFARTGRVLSLRSGRTLPLAPLEALAQVERPAGGLALAHYAFLTREKAAGDVPGYIAENRALTAFVAGQARRLRVAGVFSTSSGAVYRPDGDSGSVARAEPASPSAERALDTDLAGNPYGALKLEEEAAFARLRAETGLPCAICRVFNLAGPFINPGYALSSFLLALREGRPIVVQARGPVLRSYVHVGDAVAVGLAGMTGLLAPPEAPYDTAGEETVEIGALARRIGTALGLPDRAVIREAFTDDPAASHRYVGDGRVFARLARALGLAPAGLDRQIRDTAAYLGVEARGGAR